MNYAVIIFTNCCRYCYISNRDSSRIFQKSTSKFFHGFLLRYSKILAIFQGFHWKFQQLSLQKFSSFFFSNISIGIPIDNNSLVYFSRDVNKVVKYNFFIKNDSLLNWEKDHKNMRYEELIILVWYVEKLSQTNRVVSLFLGGLVI